MQKIKFFKGLVIATTIAYSTLFTAAQAAALTSVQIDCGAVTSAGGTPITGSVGDTVLFNNTGGIVCNFTGSTPASISGPSTIAAGGSSTYTLVSAGAGNMNFGEQTVPFTVTAAPAASTASVPTLSEYAMLIMAFIMTIFAARAIQKRGHIPRQH